MSTSLVSVATLIFNISTLSFENSVLRPNGNLLLTTATNGTLLEIDPNAANPRAKLIASFGGASVLGINTIGHDKYAIVGGIESSGLSPWTNETVYTVDLSTSSDSVTPVAAATIDEAELLDGLVALPGNNDLILVTDALQGVVYRVDLSNGTSTVILEDDAFAGSPGVNGIKILDGYAYFCNSELATYGRFSISDDGATAGDIEILATDASADDFALDENGVAYLGRQESPYSVYRVFANGTQATIAKGADMGRPNSLDLAEDGVTGYVTTSSGQVFKFDVPAI